VTPPGPPSAEGGRTNDEQAPPRAKNSRSRGVVTGLLVLLACVCLVASIIGVWGRRNLLATARFTDRVAPLADDPAFDVAVSDALTRQVNRALDLRTFIADALPDRARILAVPLANALEGYIHDRVVKFVESDRFSDLFEKAVRRAHEAAIRILKDESQVVQTSSDGTITLNFVPVIQAILAQLGIDSPGILGSDVKLPEVSSDTRVGQAIDRLETALHKDLPPDFGQITVYDDGRLEAAQQALRRFDQLLVALLVLTVAFTAGALVVSRRRRRTLLQLLFGAAVGVIVLRRVLFALGDELSAAPKIQVNRNAVRVIVDRFFDPLLSATEILLGGLLLIAVVAVLTGPYPWMVSLRHRVARLFRAIFHAVSDRATDDATVSWVAAHRDAVQIGAAALAMVVLWAVDLSWPGVLVVLVLLGVVVVAVQRIEAPPPSVTP
jgi:hypothetical protein